MTLQKIQDSNKPFIIGADEVGYGSLAGPLVVFGVRAPKDWSLDGLNDSKKLSEKRRLALGRQLFKLVFDNEIQMYCAERSSWNIDEVGVASALKSAYVEIFQALNEKRDALIVSDGILNFKGMSVDDHDMVSLIKADNQIPSVMAASILAKNYRDDYMKLMHEHFPNYGWDHNVGYGSKVHLEAIKQYGPSKMHRFSYAPMKNMKVNDE
jgi:ribonuclease HII